MCVFGDPSTSDGAVVADYLLESQRAPLNSFVDVPVRITVRMCFAWSSHRPRDKVTHCAVLVLGVIAIIFVRESYFY